jgi:hypothetical protein
MILRIGEISGKNWHRKIPSVYPKLGGYKNDINEYVLCSMFAGSNWGQRGEASCCHSLPKIHILFKKGLVLL